MRAGRARWLRERACIPCRPTPARSRSARSLPSSPRARAFSCERRAARTSITSSIRRTLPPSAEAATASALFACWRREGPTPRPCAAARSLSAKARMMTLASYLPLIRFPLRARALPAQPNPRGRFGRGGSPPPSVLASVEKSFRHRVDDGRGVGGDGIDARLDLGQRAEGLLEEMLRVILHRSLELGPRHHARHQPHGVGLGGGVAMA